MARNLYSSLLVLVSVSICFTQDIVLETGDAIATIVATALDAADSTGVYKWSNLYMTSTYNSCLQKGTANTPLAYRLFLLPGTYRCKVQNNYTSETAQRCLEGVYPVYPEDFEIVLCGLSNVYVMRNGQLAPRDYLVTGVAVEHWYDVFGKLNAPTIVDFCLQQTSNYTDPLQLAGYFRFCLACFAKDYYSYLPSTPDYLIANSLLCH